MGVGVVGLFPKEAISATLVHLTHGNRELPDPSPGRSGDARPQLGGGWARVSSWKRAGGEGTNPSRLQARTPDSHKPHAGPALGRAPKRSVERQCATDPPGFAVERPRRAARAQARPTPRPWPSCGHSARRQLASAKSHSGPAKRPGGHGPAAGGRAPPGVWRRRPRAPPSGGLVGVPHDWPQSARRHPRGAGGAEQTWPTVPPDWPQSPRTAPR